MAQLSANEQLMLELVNRARLDPNAEAKRFGIDLNQGLSAGQIKNTTKAPLASNALLTDSALGHSRWMLDTDVFSHTGAGGSTPTNRMVAAGYVLSGSWATGENISFTGTTGTINATRRIIAQHKDLFLSSGHRTNILSESFHEIGIGQKIGVFTSSGTNYNSSMVTQNFAKTGTAIFLTGVAYNDASGDDFYSVGEGRSGVAINVSGTAGSTQAAGGYQIKTSAGIRDITFGTGSTAVKVKATILSENAKIDLVDGKTVESSVSIELVSGVTSAKLLGLNALTLKGAAAAETLYGNAGANALFGGGGNDTLQGKDGNDTLVGSTGADKLDGGAGTDAASYAGSSKGVVANLATPGQNTNDAAGDSYTAIEGLAGSSYADKLYGNSYANGLLGGSGDDVLSAGSGNDRLYGALGADDLTGGLGGDAFIFKALSDSTVASTGRDTIFDFSGAAGDRIDFSAIDASTNSTGNQGFSYIRHSRVPQHGGRIALRQTGHRHLHLWRCEW
ncbi:CAP domain-containing protein [Rhizobium sp. RCAM05350]|nr:CAP domain-containing protein [Rhizobium sp. RCAM05350]